MSKKFLFVAMILSAGLVFGSCGNAETEEEETPVVDSVEVVEEVVDTIDTLEVVEEPVVEEVKAAPAKKATAKKATVKEEEPAPAPEMTKAERVKAFGVRKDAKVAEPKQTSNEEKKPAINVNVKIGGK